MTLEETQTDILSSEGKQFFFKDNPHMENLSNALVSFLSLSKQVQRPETFLLEKISDIEARRSKDDLNSNPKNIGNNEKKERVKELKSLHEFIKETAPKNWSIAVMQDSLKNWIEGLKKDYGIALDFSLEVVFNSEKNQIFLKINESCIRLYAMKEWKILLANFREDESWKEVNNDDMIETKGLNNIKYIEATILDSINKNKHSYLHEILWLAYKTSENFIMFKNKMEKKHHVFLEEGDFLTSIEF